MIKALRSVTIAALAIAGLLAAPAVAQQPQQTAKPIDHTWYMVDVNSHACFETSHTKYGPNPQEYRKDLMYPERTSVDVQKDKVGAVTKVTFTEAIGHGLDTIVEWYPSLELCRAESAKYPTDDELR